MMNIQGLKVSRSQGLKVSRSQGLKVSNVRTKLRTCWLVFALAACFSPAQAAKLSSAERDLLQAQAARNGGYVSVMLTLAELSLAEIRQRGPEAIHEETEAIASHLRVQLADQMLPTGAWNNRLGQVGFVVSLQGLQVLEQSNLVKALQPDTTRGLRDLAWTTPATRHAIAKALRTDGLASVDIVLNSEIDYTIAEDGSTSYVPSAAAASEHARLLQQLQATAGAGLEIVDDRLVRQGASAKLRARIDRAAYDALRAAPGVRALQVAGPRVSSWPEIVLSTADLEAGTRVILSLHGADGYSPYRGYMSRSAWASQAAAHTRAFDALLSDIGAGSGTAAAAEPSLHAGIGSLSVRLSRESLQTLYARRDPRVRAVELVRPMGGPALDTSMGTAMVNMVPAWAAGHRGAGQFIIILDTGTRKDHDFFKDGAGLSRVTTEACFGTTDSTYKSICPPPPPGSPPVGPGDSLVGQPGSGMPYSDAVYCAAQPDMCNHGTHVAGIAAGRSRGSLLPAGIQGMMPDAQLVAVQLFSFPKVGTSKSPGWFNDDLLAALNAVVAAAPPGAMSPYVVNASIMGSQAIHTCDYFSPSIAASVSDLLSRGVPLVAAAGNNWSSTHITFPACIREAIKVSSVFNSPPGETRADQANVANPAMFGDADPLNFEGPILFAPGHNIVSARATSPTAMGPAGGTSQATPHVSGLLAGVKEAIPSASVADAVAWVISPAGSVNVNVNLGGVMTSFRRIKYAGP